MMLFEKFGQHQPLNRQAERYGREGVPLSLSTLADQVGACMTVLMPLFHRLQAHVMAAGRLHGDDTTVPVLAAGQDRHRPALDLEHFPSHLAREVLYLIVDRAVQRIDALFDIERDINGHPAEVRQATRRALSAPLVAELHRWLGEQRTRLARGNDVARAIDYLLKRWTAFTRFLDDGRICLSNNAAERALRGIALGHRSWLFCGSDRGGQRRGDV